MKTLIAALFLAGAGLPAIAASCDGPKPVSLDGQVVLRVRTDAADMSCTERANIIQDRIVAVLSGPVKAYEISAMMKNGEWAVYADDIMVITADENSARMNGTSTKDLAMLWASNLRATIPDALPWGYSTQGQRYAQRMASAR